MLCHAMPYHTMLRHAIQLKIFSTAAFAVVLLGRNITSPKWRALLLLVLGCILVASPTFNRPVDCTLELLNASKKGNPICYFFLFFSFFFFSFSFFIFFFFISFSFSFFISFNVLIVIFSFSHISCFHVMCDVLFPIFSVITRITHLFFTNDNCRTF